MRICIMRTGELDEYILSIVLHALRTVVASTTLDRTSSESDELVTISTRASPIGDKSPG
jgi:hypothetical protein